MKLAFWTLMTVAAVKFILPYSRRFGILYERCIYWHGKQYYMLCCIMRTAKHYFCFPGHFAGY